MHSSRHRISSFGGGCKRTRLMQAEAKGNLPTVAIVGRPNVGKSALFNRLAQKRIAIVHDEPGVTRDRLVAECKLGSRPFTVIDTGGIGGLRDSDFADRLEAEADLAMEMADVIVLVVDSQDG